MKNNANMKTTALLLLLTASIVAVTTASANWIYWTSWSTNTAGSITTPQGAISVTYSGELSGYGLNYPSWTPYKTFADGNIVDNAPPPDRNMIRLYGGVNLVDTITFSSPVVNPVFSIWSLGAAGTPAKFEFIKATPTFLVGGPSHEYAGSQINVSGNTVSGNEGNGTIRFLGTYSSISWKSTLRENFYGFTVGVPSTEREKEHVTISPPDFRPKVTIETECTWSLEGRCLRVDIVRICVGGNDHCFDVPPIPRPTPIGKTNPAINQEDSGYTR